jgi:hypothetical protein
MAMDHERLLGIKSRAAAELLTRPEVTAVGVGGRERGGRPTGEIVIKVFVRRKRPLAELDPAEVLPAEYEGVGIDVSQMPPGELDTDPGDLPDPDPDAHPIGDEPDRPAGVPFVDVDKEDKHKYRPLVGGIRIQTDHTDAGHGTLGAIVVHRDDPAKVYALTNFHVVDSGTEETAAGDQRVGQPSNFASSTKCCSHQFGTFQAGSRDEVRDAAVVQLDPGTQWQAEVVDIGPIAGTHRITLEEAATLQYFIQKRGARTGLTGGTLEALAVVIPLGDGTTRNDVMITTPLPNPGVPDDEITYFALGGDSGSLWLNEFNEVVGLHFGGATDDDHNVRKGWALAIGTVLGTFETDDGLPLAMATAEETGIVQTVAGLSAIRVPEELVSAMKIAEPGVRVLAPAGTHPRPGAAVPGEDLLAAVRARLDTSPAGRAVVALWTVHRAELVRLVGEQRRVAVVWHRCGGPALVQTLIRMTAHHDLELPRTINGEPLDDCLGRIHDAFAAKASPELRLALRTARDALPDLAGLTYPGIITALEGVRT